MQTYEECSHCGLDAIFEIKETIDDTDCVFCCYGCQTVYHILQSSGLDEYYSLRDEKKAKRSYSGETFEYLDDEKFRDEFTQDDNGSEVLEFYLEGIHCLACLWLIEKLPSLYKEVESASLNMSTSVVRVILKQGGEFSKVAQTYARLGYRPHPLLDKNDKKIMEKKEDRKMLIKIGVAFACMGNIMLLSVSLYGGATGYLSDQFRWYTFLLSLPVLLFSARPFYQSALSALRNRIFSMDIPIAIALVVGAAVGVFGLFTGRDLIFFDSLTMLVFLLLTTRYILKRVQKNVLNSSNLSSLYENAAVKRFDAAKNEYIETYSSYLEIGDLIRIDQGSLIPVDGKIIEGESYINNSLLTGESYPVSKSCGDEVYSGSKNIEKPIVVEVLKVGASTRFGRILEQVEQGWGKNSEMKRLTERLSQYFTVTLFVVAFITLLGVSYFVGFEEALIRSLALLIITCPCALAISGPLTMTLALGKLLRKGILIKNENTLEKLLSIKKIYLDKTGTITYGEFGVEKILLKEKLSLEGRKRLFQILFSMESRSEHPVARSIKKHFLVVFREEKSVLEELEIESFKEIPGLGVSCEFEGEKYEAIKSTGEARVYLDSKIEKSKQVVVNKVDIIKNGTLVGEIYLQDRIRKEARLAIKSLIKRGIEPFLLSGDREEIVKKIGKEAGIDERNLLGNITPEQKHEIVGDDIGVMMIGDGINDSMALKRSYVGVSVEGSAEISLKASDIYLSQSGVHNVAALFDISSKVHKIIYTNLVISLFYNLIGAGLTIMGFISPLLCAVLMPLSSFCVICVSLLGTRSIDKKLK